MDILSTTAEKKAEKAEGLNAFSGLKLAHVKSQLTFLLGMIGREGIFDEYTRHDISHIDKMLGMLDWLVPEETKNIMSPADWLMTVLAIYLHDLGMLVTKREYELRDTSGFPEFRDRNLFGGDGGEDYKAKVEKLGPDKAERFAYQEFVRHKHAERIRAWILGQEREHLGISNDILSELDTLLAPLNTQFRRDLALVCESHHLNDLDDFNKYKTSQPYGDSDDETANVQYAAVLMRTADLLHLTNDRTPSISYRVINPTDPISQDEWSKQMAVRRVRSQIGRDKEGNPSEAAVRDTIEVHADFKKEDGFFGLTSYLQYASDQLQHSYEWVLKANKSQGAKHKFPWRYIDDSHIATEGFIKETFEFTFDQAKILDLLTGHTLYNDIKIVLRELVQNSIDAVRLQYLIDSKSSLDASFGTVAISWDTSQRTLTVEDTGTGMTQNVIERNLLKVGASRYQGEDFKNEHPGFSSISRFGIGILSTFMIADSVEIITCHPEDEQARQLSLRSVHGKYLIRLLDKHTEQDARTIVPHGTRIKLRVRHGIDMSDIVYTARRWIVIPNCEVTLTIDDKEPISIGFSSPKEAVKSYLQNEGINVDESADETRGVKIIETKVGNVTLAYAVSWSKYFKEWGFVNVFIDEETSVEPLLGTCVEGIRVEFNTPGYNGYSIVALSNATGVNAPKTDVARSGLEATPERDNMFSSIYTMLCKHVDNEITALHSRRSFSLTWAVQESKYLLSPLLRTRGNSRPSNISLLYEKVNQLPLILVERDGRRSALSAQEVQQGREFWTIDSESFRSAETLIREVSGNASLSAFVSALNEQSFRMPSELLLCGAYPSDPLSEHAYAGKEIVSIKVDQSQRRIDLKWSNQSIPARWQRMPNNIDLSRVLRMERNRRVRSANVWTMNVGRGDIELIGIHEEIAVRAFGQTYLIPNTPVAKILLAQIDVVIQHPRSQKQILNLYFLFELFQRVMGGRMRLPMELNTLKRMAEVTGAESVEDLNLQGLLDIVNNTRWIVFDTSAWVRNPKEDSETEFDF